MVKPHSHYRSALLALAFSAATLLNACSNHAGIDGPAPVVSFKTLKSAVPLKLDELGKPLLVNFWSTSCGVCLQEMPHLAELYEEFKPEGFEMVAVAMSFDRPSDVVELSEGANWPFIVALDLNNYVAEAFGDIEFTPTAFLIDANGDMVEKYVGAIDLKQFRKTLKKLTSATNSG